MLLVFDCTWRCNLNCSHCYRRKSDELSFEEIKRMLNEAKKIGVTHLGVSGGEPLMRDDIIDILKYAKEMNFAVKLNTNGTLITKEFARKVKKFVDEVQVSIDGVKETHNKLRSNSFDDAVKGIKILVNEGIHTTICMCVNKENYTEVPKVLNLALELGVKTFRVIRYIPIKNKEIEVIGKKEAYSLLKFLLIARELLKNRIEIRIDETSCFLGIGGCIAGKKCLGVLPNGDVIPCIFMPDFVGGNIRENSLAEIWNCEKFREIRESKVEECSGCKFFNTCNGGCKAFTFYTKGSIHTRDPRCFRI